MLIKLLISWFRPTVFLLPMFLSGCGFQPLYKADPTDIPKELHAVRIEVIADRPGQILRNHLIDTITPKGTNKAVQYILNVQITESKRKSGFRRDRTARHEELIIDSTINLVHVESDRTIFKDTVRKIASYSLGSEAEVGSFSANVAEQTSRERALLITAQEIKLRLASFFKKNKCHET